MTGTVVVTGGGQGIGRACCHDLAARGYRVVVADIRHDLAQQVAEEIKDKGLDALGLHLDVADEESCRTAARTLEENDGHLHGLVNNAALFSTLTMKPFWEIDLAEWNRVLAVNLTGAWLTTKALLPLLRRSDEPRVVNISASAVWFGRENYAHYVASKAGMIGLTRAMARELGDHGVRVNAITPGSIDTGIPRGSVTPEQRAAITRSQMLQKVLTSDDLSGAVAFLLGRDSASITGQVLNVDGGMVTR
ncbi:(S)-1-Phenylethanol dehydrogenase (plasmid) [Streptomyces sp. enrichment culture]|uniref:SDR family NAD(P)-dependent oxidoreductase n=1 Tax=Streptomyces sp. enrichment culture TaxID=1795815 RepID=UPI003F557D67